MSDPTWQGLDPAMAAKHGLTGDGLVRDTDMDTADGQGPYRLVATPEFLAAAGVDSLEALLDPDDDEDEQGP